MTELVLAPEIEEVKVLAGRQFELKPKKVQAILFTDEDSGLEIVDWVNSFGDADVRFDPAQFVPGHQSTFFGFYVPDRWTKPEITIQSKYSDDGQFDNWFDSVYLDVGEWVIRTDSGAFESMSEEEFNKNYQEV